MKRLLAQLPGLAHWCLPLRKKLMKLESVLIQPNTAIERTRHPMPTTDELINDLNSATIFSKLDLRQRYHQLMLDEESINLTTFSTHKALCLYKRLCVCVNSAAEIFQNKISETIQDILNAKIYVT